MIMQNSVLADKLMIVKAKFIELCQKDGLDNLQSRDHKFAIIDHFIVCFENVQLNYINCWLPIRDKYQFISSKNYYQQCLHMLDFMIRYARLNAFW